MEYPSRTKTIENVQSLLKKCRHQPFVEAPAIKFSPNSSDDLRLGKLAPEHTSRYWKIAAIIASLSVAIAFIFLALGVSIKIDQSSLTISWSRAKSAIETEKPLAELNLQKTKVNEGFGEKLYNDNELELVSQLLHAIAHDVETNSKLSIRTDRRLAQRLMRLEQEYILFRQQSKQANVKPKFTKVSIDPEL